MSVRADQIQVGDTLRLPDGRTVHVEAVDHYPDRTIIIRWAGGSVYRAPIAEPARRARRREIASAVA